MGQNMILYDTGGGGVWRGAKLYYIILERPLNTVAQVQPTSQILHVAASDVLTQFILDCTSINLDDSIRVPAHNPGIDKLFQVSRDWCFALSNERSRLLYKENKKK